MFPLPSIIDHLYYESVEKKNNKRDYFIEGNKETSIEINRQQFDWSTARKF